MVSQSEIKEIKRRLKEVYDAVSSKPKASHEDVRDAFNKVLEYLGYPEKNRLHERASKAGRSDLRLITDDGLIHAIVEFKRPGDQLDRNKLREYMYDVYLKNAIFTDGKILRIYELVVDELKEIGSQVLLNDPDDTTLAILYERFKKPKIPLTPEKLLEFVKGIEKRPIPIVENLEEFISKFSLSPTPFAELVLSTFRLYRFMKGRSPESFAAKTFRIWRKYYAPTLKEAGGRGKLKAWREMLKSTLDKKPEESDLYEFMFAIETAYAMTSRIMLLRVCGDYDFGVGPVWIERLCNEIRSDSGLRVLSGAGLHTYVAGVIPKQFGKLSLDFPSIFEEDFFDWWNDAFQPGRFFRFEDMLRGEVPEPIARFSTSLLLATLVALSFSFKDITSDVLGTLYQQYFDPATRKAFGEFYTPPEIVEYILDQVGYKTGDGTLLERTLIDPACGSGTFLIMALRRYLKEAEERVKQGDVKWEGVLTNLCDGIAICGLDINPFAVLIAQINYAIQIMPHYAKARQSNPYFRILGIPVLKTDTLRLPFPWGKTSIIDRFSVELPIGDSDKVEFLVPTVGMLREVGVLNLVEAVRLLRSIYKVARRVAAGENLDRALSIELRHMKPSIAKTTKTSQKLMTILNSIIACLKELKERIGDKRLAKWVGDELVVSALKSEPGMRFDFVVCNPPYVTAYKAEEELKMCRDYEYHLVTGVGKRDLAYPFLEWGLKKLKRGGKFGYIMTDKWIEWAGREKVRDYVLNNTKVIEIIDSTWIKFFKEARNYVIILILEKTKEWSPDDPLRTASLFKESPTNLKDSLSEIKNQLDILESRYKSDEIERSHVGDYYVANIWSYKRIKGKSQSKSDDPWSPFLRLTPTEIKVMRKLENLGKKLENCNDFREVKGKKFFEGIVTAGNPLFLLDESEEESLGNELDKTTKLTAQGVDIERWGIINKELGVKEVVIEPCGGINWDLIERTSLTNKKRMIFPYVQKKDGWTRMGIANYDSTKNLAIKKADEIIKEERRAKAAASFLKNSLQDGKLYFIDKRANKYVERKPPKLLTFRNPRLICRDTSRWNSWMLDSNAEVYPLNTCYFLALKSENDRPLYYLGLINSSIVEFYHKSWAPILAGATFRYRVETIHRYPLIPYDTADVNIRSRIVDLARESTTLVSQIKDAALTLQEFLKEPIGAIRNHIRRDIDFSAEKIEVNLNNLSVEIYRPLSKEDENKIIKFLKDIHNKITSFVQSVCSKEKELKEEVTKLYGLSSNDASTIDGYLKRVSPWLKD